MENGKFANWIVSGVMMLAAFGLYAETRDIRRLFLDPPKDARPHVWYHWNGEYVNETNMVRDLRAMADFGYATAYIFSISGYGMPAPNAKPMSESYLKLMTAAIAEAKSAGLTLGFHNCPGWSSSGGPWIKPEDSMKMVVFSESDAVAGADGSVCLKLAQPKASCGFYRDLAVYAFPLGEVVSPNENPFPHLFRVKETGASEAVEIGYPKPIAPRYFIFRNEFSKSSTISCRVLLEALLDGAWTPLATVACNYNNATRENRVIRIKDPVRSDRFRMTVTSTVPEPWVKPDDVDISSFVLSSLPYVSDILSKNCASRSCIDPRPEDPSEPGIDPERVVDLSLQLAQSGELAVSAGTLSPGEGYRFVRIGYTSTGVGPHPCTVGGLECDKLDRRGVEAHWREMPAKVLALPGAKGTVEYVVVDSYEVGGQNWTERFPEEFRRRAGYDIGKHLLSICGYTLENATKTAGFLRDLQRVVAELFAENYYDRFCELCHESGVKAVVEPYGGPYDGVRCAKLADVPSGEFWLGRSGHHSIGTMRQIVRKYGHRIVAAESFTTEAKEGRWQITPRELREVGDAIGWANGVNRIVVHSYLHQAFGDDRIPGVSMGRHGTQLNRHTTWWKYGRAWTDYVARGQALLQYGRPAQEADGVPAPRTPKSIRVLRREGDCGERIYFLVNDSSAPFFGTVGLSAPAGTHPELFDAKSGEIRAVANRPDGEFTEVQLDLLAHESAFVVFTADAPRSSLPILEKRPRETVLADLSEDWSLGNFYGLGAPKGTMPVARLFSWSESSDPDLRYFSGSATYERTVDVPEDCWLDFGEVRDLANVLIDGGKSICLWCPPYRMRIPAGRHRLAVEVVNAWPNRLIGDAKARAAGRPSHTWVNWDKGWTAADEPIPAGLIGPVRLYRGGYEK